jgi:hypothetical protein
MASNFARCSSIISAREANSLVDWYLANSNAFFTAPFDFELWCSLDAKTAIAS